jgi:hypothetical protein
MFIPSVCILLLIDFILTKLRLLPESHSDNVHFNGYATQILSVIRTRSGHALPQSSSGGVNGLARARSKARM